MIEEKVIKSNGSKFIGEFMADLPDNVMLNKVTTGCGMTSLVLENDINYVLVVPYVSLIKNKKTWCKERGIEICTVYYGGANEDVIKGFKGKKIIATYDSLGKVTKVLKERGDLKNWKLCVDESHKLVDSASFRPNAIINVLDNYRSYKSFVFGTATPVNSKYQLPKLKDIPTVKIQWDNLETVRVNYCHYTEKINDVAAVLALDFINGEREGNAHIFINSVRSIIEIIRKMKKGGFNKHSNIRIVCADSPGNDNLIETKLSKDYYIVAVGSEVKKVNFYTATAFEGCDIYDEEGKNFIVTDGNKNCTKIDIVTVLPQIIGRVRNSVYNNTVDLIYTGSKYLPDITEEEFEKTVHHGISEAKKDIQEFNQLRKGSTHRVNAIEKNDNPYLFVDGEQLCLNDNAWYNEMHNYSTMNNTYYVSRDGTQKAIVDGVINCNGLGYEYKGINRIEIKGLNKVKLGKVTTFKDLCLDCITIFKSDIGLLRSSKLVMIKANYPLIHESYNVLGEHKMKALCYRKSSLEEALLIFSNKPSNSYKIVKLLDLKTGQFYSLKEIKLFIQNVYIKLGISKKAKATDLNNWYNILKKYKRRNGSLENGLTIIGCKIKMNK